MSISSGYETIMRHKLNKDVAGADERSRPPPSRRRPEAIVTDE